MRWHDVEGHLFLERLSRKEVVLWKTEQQVMSRRSFIQEQAFRDQIIMCLIQRGAGFVNVNITDHLHYGQ